MFHYNEEIQHIQEPVSSFYKLALKKCYRIDVVFEPDLARVTLDGTVFDLTQYVTADGFGYKNDMMDLRGKGREATLTMRDGLILSLTERK